MRIGIVLFIVIWATTSHGSDYKVDHYGSGKYCTQFLWHEMKLDVYRCHYDFIEDCRAYVTKTNKQAGQDAFYCRKNPNKWFFQFWF